MELKLVPIYNTSSPKTLKSSTFHQIFFRLFKKTVLLQEGYIVEIKIMTEERFIDTFNRKHNPDYYYGKNTQKKKTEKKKNDRKRYAVKRYPVFKVQD